MTAFQSGTARTADGLPILVVSGDVDIASADRLIASALDLVGAGPSLVLDLAGVTFMDSTGLSALLSIRSDLTQRDGDITLAGVSPSVRRVLELVGMLDTFALSAEPTE